MNEAPTYFSAAAIAVVMQCSKKSVQRKAEAQGWPRQIVGNRIEFTPPAEILVRLQSPEEPAKPATERRVKFEDLAHDSEVRALVRHREDAVLKFRELIKRQLPVEYSLSLTVTHFAPTLGTISTRTLRNWDQAYRDHGINGLVEQKRGIVGRPGLVLPDELVQLGQAMAVENGSIARAARHLATHPGLPADVRLHLHEGHPSKSYVPPSIRQQLKTAPLTAERAQGSRHARLSDRFTPCKYDDVRAGEVFVSDDMTNNGMCWCEWPNARGWRMGQPQILPVMDVGSLRWLNVRVIMRESGQYTADDIWGLFGDVFDTFGLPAKGFVLEGGHWQSNAVKGHKTGIDDEDRIGGLESLGLEIYRSYDPRSKIIETMFNQLQYEVDRVQGYTGRDQRKQLPEHVKKQIALCEDGGVHPSKFFPHITQLADHIRTKMANLNNEPGDGKILRGLTPLEQWAEHGPELSQIPDSAKWLYRSAMNVCKVTKNGARVSQGSGKNRVNYYFDNPEHLTPRRGCNVVVYWNDRNPEADAVIQDAFTRKFICMAKFVPELNRFTATPAQLDAEADRKKAAMLYARTELRAIQPELQRRQLPARMDLPTQRIGESLKDAVERQTTEEKQLRDSRREVRATELAPTDLEAVLGNGATEEPADRNDLDIVLGSHD